MPQFDGGCAFIVGVAGYKHSALVLEAPVTVNEAVGLAQTLRDGTLCAYPSDHVKLLKDPTSRGLLDELDEFVNQVAGDGKASMVLLFFAGHGVLGSDGLYYFTTQETELTPQGLAVPGTAVSAPQLLERLRKIKSKKLLFVIDACFSGNVQPSLGPAVGTPPTPSLGVEILASGEGRVLISSSRPTQRSYYDLKGTYTYFGSALINGLKGNGVGSSGGYVGLYELYLHVFDSVNQTVGALGAAQEPMLTILQGVGPFPVALHPQAATLGTLDSRAIQPSVTPGRGAIEESVISFGSGNRIGSVQIGEAAGRDVVHAEVHVVMGNEVHQTIVRHYPALKDYDSAFSELINTTTSGFVGREFIFKRLEEFQKRNPCGYLRIVADAGLGKTALAAGVARRYGAPAFFVDAIGGRTEPALCLKYLSAQLILPRQQRRSHTNPKRERGSAEIK